MILECTLSASRLPSELRDLPSDNEVIKDADGNIRKIIVFAEHRGHPVVSGRMHSRLARLSGGRSNHPWRNQARQRRKVMELFAQNVDCRVLIATDAGDEGLDLQRADMMVNYDLPWNPNRIEQLARTHRTARPP